MQARRENKPLKKILYPNYVLDLKPLPRGNLTRKNSVESLILLVPVKRRVPQKRVAGVALET